MPNFVIHGLNVQNELLETVIEASNRSELNLIAQEQGIRILNVEQAGRTTNRVKHTFDLPLFTEELIALLSAGLSLIETLETLSARQYTNQRSNSIIHELVKLMREGQSFSKALESFADIFPEIYISSIRASEQTGGIVDALKRYLNYHNQVNQIREKVISASIYPILLSIVGLSVSIFLLCYLVPRFSYTYQNIQEDLPIASKWLMQWGAFVNQNIQVLLITLMVLIGILFAAFRHPKTSLFITNSIQNSNLLKDKATLFHFSRFSRSLSMLLSGGIPLTKSLELASKVLPSNIQNSALSISEEIKEGKTLSESLEKTTFSTPVGLRLIRAGEKNGQLAEMLERTAQFHEKELSTWVDKFMKLFEPILMLFIGLAIGGVVILLYLPIFELTSGLK